MYVHNVLNIIIFFVFIKENSLFQFMNNNVRKEKKITSLTKVKTQIIFMFKLGRLERDLLKQTDFNDCIFDRL